MAKVDHADLRGLKPRSFARRRTFVKLQDFGTLADGTRAADLLNSLPSLRAGRDLRAAINDIVRAHRRGKSAACAMGDRVIQAGCGPLLADLVARGVITAVMMSGAAAIQDYELSKMGRTSEGVAGMSRQTAEAFAQAALVGSTGAGLGCALGEMALRNRHRRCSLLAVCVRRGVPVMVSLPIGTAPYPSGSGRDFDESARIDSRIFSDVIARVEGGVGLMLGPAGLLFLPCGLRLAALAWIQGSGGKSSAGRPREKEVLINGPPEILLPLVRAGVVAAMEGRSIRR